MGIAPIETVGQAIRAAREIHRMEAKQLASFAALSPQYLCDIELGRRLPTPDVLARISRAPLGLSFPALLWLWFAEEVGDEAAGQVRRFLTRTG